MEGMFERYKRPLHDKINPNIIFLTARTFDRINFFRSPESKRLFILATNLVLKQFRIKCYAWVILGWHYHLLIHLDSTPIYKIVQKIHGYSSRLLNARQRVWCNYWERRIRSERDFWTHINYIHNNPVHHNIIQKTNQLSQYHFSSYNYYLSKFGPEWMLNLWTEFPVRDLKLDFDPVQAEACRPKQSENSHPLG